MLPAPHSMDAGRARRTPVQALEDWADEGYHLVVSRLLPYKNVERRSWTRCAERTIGWSSSGRSPGAARCSPRCPTTSASSPELTDAQMRLGLRPRTRARRAELRGLRALPARGSGLRTSEPVAARRGLPRHGARGRHRVCTSRRPRPELFRAGLGRRPTAHPWEPDGASVRTPRASPRRASRHGCTPRSTTCCALALSQARTSAGRPAPIVRTARLYPAVPTPVGDPCHARILGRGDPRPREAAPRSMPHHADRRSHDHQRGPRGTTASPRARHGGTASRRRWRPSSIDLRRREPR